MSMAWDVHEACLVDSMPNCGTDLRQNLSRYQAEVSWVEKQKGGIAQANLLLFIRVYLNSLFELCSKVLAL
jgi:hypothetical protein